MEGHETLRGRMKFEGRLLKKTCKIHEKIVKNGCEFAIRTKRSKKGLKNRIWERLGLHLGRFGEGFGRDLTALGASWVVFGALF